MNHFQEMYRNAYVRRESWSTRGIVSANLPRKHLCNQKEPCMRSLHSFRKRISEVVSDIQSIKIDTT